MVEFGQKYSQKDWVGALQALAPVFEAVRPEADWASRDMVRQAAKKTLQFLAQDLEALRNEGAFIFSIKNESEDLTRQTVDMLRRWHIAERSPSLSALTIFALENLNPDLPPDIAEGLLVGSVLGEVENNLPYHNNMHYKKVLLQLVRMIAVHNNIYEGTTQAFDDKQVGILLLAACIHDLGHDGKGNTIKGVFEAGRLEKRALELAEPYLEACGMERTDLKTIKVMLLCTDVAPIGDPANPVNQMKSAYRYHFLGQKRKIGQLNLDSDLAILQKDTDLTMMCIALHEADIGTSAGLDYNVTSYETSLYKTEMGESESYPQDVVYFLEDICQRQMLSDAAQRLYAANMARIFALAERDIDQGNQPYPKPEYSEFLRVHPSGSNPGTGKTIN